MFCIVYCFLRGFLFGDGCGRCWKRDEVLIVLINFKYNFMLDNFKFYLFIWYYFFVWERDVCVFFFELGRRYSSYKKKIFVGICVEDRYVISMGGIGEVEGDG